MVKKDYKKTEIGVIPEDWRYCKIEEYIDLLTGYPFPSNNYSIDGTRLLRGSNIKRGNTDWSEQITQYWEKLTPEIKKYLLKENDIVIAMDGSLVGKSFAQLSKDDLPALLLQRVARMRTSIIDIGYLKEFVCSPYFTEHCDKVKTSSAIPHISPKDIREFTIPLPPTITEQKAIATALTDIDNLITNSETLITKKKAIKQGAMQQLLTGKKRLKGFTGEWITKKIRDFSDVGRGRVISHNEINKSKAKKYPVYSSQTANNGVMGYIDTFDFDGDYITWTTDGENAGTVFLRNGKFNCTNVCGTIKLKSNNFSFISYLLSTIAPNYVSRNLANPKLMNEPMKNIELTFPKDIKEQQAIAQILSDMDTEIEALETQKSKTQHLKQGMMQELLTGKTRLVKPANKATKKENKTVAIAAEPQPNYKTENARNEHFNDAVLIGTMAKEFGSEKYPLTRFMYTKVSYLFKRYKEEQDKGYLKKAAGPYKPKTRYGGAEKIALGSKYVKPHISNYKGKKHEHFLAGDEYQTAVDYFIKWFGSDALQWIRQFKYTKRPMLELWTTVDMAMEDLKQDNQPINLQSVKSVIKNNKEWKDKLKKEVFSDTNISKTIKEIPNLFR